MSKKLLEESTIRQFMKLAKLEPLSDNFLHEKKHEKGLKEEEVVEEGADVEEYGGDMGEMDHGDKVNEEVLDEDLDALFEDELNEMGMDYEADDDMEMEAEAGDMEAEINITPDQARAIIAVADMLKDIMPDLEAPEAEDEEEMDMDMDMDPDAEADADMAAAEDEEADAADDEEEAEEDEEEAADDLAETVMRRVKARIREMKNK